MRNATPLHISDTFTSCQGCGSLTSYQGHLIGLFLYLIELIPSTFNSKNSLITNSNTEQSLSSILKLVQRSKYGFELVKVFRSRSEYNQYISYNFSHTRVTNNEPSLEKNDAKTM